MHNCEQFVIKLRELGFDTKQCGLHSLLAGDATAAANAGLPDCLLKQYGCWQSEVAKDRYVKDNQEVHLTKSGVLVLY